jgi:hypothetical protein
VKKWITNNARALIFGLAALMAIVLLFTFSLYDIYIESTYYTYNDENFCTTDDEIYQAIVTNLDSWTNIMASAGSSIEFSVPSGRSYRVFAPDRARYHIYMVVPVQGMLRNVYGRRGYIYSYEYMGSNNYGDDYTIRQMSNTIYCYEWVPRTYPTVQITPLNHLDN